MLPPKIDKETPDSEKAKWTLVRLDTGKSIPGDIVDADATTGVAHVSVITGKTQQEDGTIIVSREMVTIDLGANGFAIVRR